MQILNKIKLNLNQTHTHTHITARQGEKDGRVIEATLYTGCDLFLIPETFNATVDGVIDNKVVADKVPCEIKDNKVYIPITEFMCAISGNLKLILNLTEGDALVCGQEILVKVAKELIDDGVDNFVAPINDANAFLQRVTTGDFTETTGLEYERINAVENGLEETKEKLTSKGVEVAEPFGVNDIPSAVESIATDGEYKELVDGYKAQAEQAQAEATEAKAQAEAEKARADEADERATQAEAEVTPLRNSLFGLIERDVAEIVIPEGVTTIGSNTFRKCENLTSVTIPEGVTTIGECAFYECKNLTSVTIPEGVTTFGARSLQYCSNLKSVDMPESVTELGDYMFSSSGIENFTFPPKITTIPYEMFRVSSLTKAIIPSGVVKLDRGCFQSCSDLKEVYLPNTITSCDNYAFSSSTNIEKATLEQGFNCSVNLSASTKYSVETLVAMLEALADRTGLTAYTLTIGATNLAKLTDDDQWTAWSKNWTLV